jgi:hypothetical protein
MNRFARLLGAKPHVVDSIAEAGEGEMSLDDIVARLEDAGDSELLIDYDQLERALDNPVLGEYLRNGYLSIVNADVWHERWQQAGDPVPGSPAPGEWVGLLRGHELAGVLLPDDSSTADRFSLFTRAGNLTKRVSLEPVGSVDVGVSMGPDGNCGLAGRYGCEPGLCGCQEIKLYGGAESIACRCPDGRP